MRVFDKKAKGNNKSSKFTNQMKYSSNSLVNSSFSNEFNNVKMGGKNKIHNILENILESSRIINKY